jgi:hypothetical protein
MINFVRGFSENQKAKTEKLDKTALIIHIGHEKPQFDRANLAQFKGSIFKKCESVGISFDETCGFLSIAKNPESTFVIRGDGYFYNYKVGKEKYIFNEILKHAPKEFIKNIKNNRIVANVFESTDSYMIFKLWDISKNDINKEIIKKHEVLPEISYGCSTL